MAQTKRLLIIDDEEPMLEMLSAVTSGAGYLATLACNGEEGLAALAGEPFDLILCDLKMPGINGLEVLTRAKATGVEAPVIMMSACAAIADAVEAMKAGAYDFITKPFQADELLLTLERADEHLRLQRENQSLRRRLNALQESVGIDGMVARSSTMRSLIETATKVARYDTTVLITGESGTGKELVARGIHRASGRAGKQFLAINCGGIPESLLESELFGYVKGAFTGADRNRKGIFQEAEGGTLFLDEIGELPLEAQVKLLRVLQEKEARPVGAACPLPVDVRVLAATAKDLEREVTSGRFREDLFYRLNVIRLHVPPLRERPEDLPPLCTRLLERIAVKLDRQSPLVVSPTAMVLLLRYRWPGNVRELENALERAAVLAEGNVIMPSHLPEKVADTEKPDSQADIEQILGTYSLKKGRHAMERTLIAQALAATGGNKSKAGLLLEISYPSLLAKMKEYGL